MPIITNTEFYNENGNRNYPFQDDSDLIDTAGKTLDNSLIVDGMLYPIGSVGAPQLKELNKSADTITIADSATGNVLMTSLSFSPYISAYPSNRYNYINVVLQDEYNRHAGNLILDFHIYMSLAPGIIYTFNTGVAKFATSCFISLVEDRVQGFKLPDGSFIKRDVVFEGRNGASVNSNNNTLEVDFLGAILTIDETTGEDCISESVPIKSIRLITTDCSKILATVYATDTIALTSREFELEDICPARVMSTYGTPDYDDVCDTKRYKLTYLDNIPANKSTVTVNGIIFEFVTTLGDEEDNNIGVLIDPSSAIYTFNSLRAAIIQFRSPVFPFADNDADEGYITIGVTAAGSVSMSMGAPFMLEEIIPPTPEPEPVVCTGAIISDEILTITNGMLYIVTPSSPSFSNAIAIEPLHADLNATREPSLNPYEDAGKKAKSLDKFKLTSPSLLLKIKGLML